MGDSSEQAAVVGKSMFCRDYHRFFVIAQPVVHSSSIGADDKLAAVMYASISREPSIEHRKGYRSGAHG